MKVYLGVIRVSIVIRDTDTNTDTDRAVVEVRVRSGLRF